MEVPFCMACHNFNQLDVLHDYFEIKYFLMLSN